MYVLLITLVCIAHLSVYGAEEQSPTSPREQEAPPRPDTPSESHTVTLHNRKLSLTRLASSLSIAATATSRSSISSLEPASPSSTSVQSMGTPAPALIALGVITTDSPKHTIPIRVSPKSASDLFLSHYLGNNRESISTLEIDDDNDITCRTCFIICTCTVCVLGGTIWAICAAISKWG